MEIGLSTACFYPMPTEQALRLAVSLGFRAIEVFFNAECEFDEGYLCEMRGILKDGGARVVSVHPYTSVMEGLLFCSAYERRTDEGLRLYERYFRAAQQLGTRSFTFHGERAMRSIPEAENTAGKGAVANLNRLCALAGNYGITVSHENVAWCRSASPTYLKSLREGVDSLGFTLDIKQAVRANVAIERYLDVMAGRLTNVHLSDCAPGRSCMLPLEGTLNYPELLSKLRAAGYDAALMIEVYASDYSCSAQLVRARAGMQALL